MLNAYTNTVCSGNTISVVHRKSPCAYYRRMGYLNGIAALRKKRGWTQGQLAEKLNVRQPTVQRWETGMREPSFEELFRVADLFGVEPGHLLSPNTLIPLGHSLQVRGRVEAVASIRQE